MFYTVLKHGNTLDYTGTFVYINTLSQFDAFALGALIIYLPAAKIKSAFSLRKLVFFSVIVFLFIGQVNLYFTNKTLLRDMTTLGYRVYLTNNYQYVWGYTIINILAAIVIFSVVNQENTVPILKNKVLIYIGKISYGMYILHIPVLLALDGLKNKGLPQTIIRLVLYFAITLTISHFSFKYFESYFARLKKKIQPTD